MNALLSRAQIAEQFDLVDRAMKGELAHIDDTWTQAMLIVRDRLRYVQIAGAQHGKLGYYPAGDFSSDADWCYGVGAEINALETELDIDDGAVFYLYAAAHGAFFRDGTINPSDRDYCGSGSEAGIYTLSFGAYGDTTIKVHAGSCEEALELAADHLHNIAPGLFMSDEEMRDALVYACEEKGITLERFRELEKSGVWGRLTCAEDTLLNTVRVAAEADLTYTESGWLRSSEWTVDGPE